MFSFLKYLAVTCIVIFIAGAAGLGIYLKQSQQETVSARIAKEHAALVKSYAESIWKVRPQGDAASDPLLSAAFQTASRNFFAAHGFAKVTVFSPDVRTLYYGSGVQGFAFDSAGKERVTLFDVPNVQRSQLASRLLQRVYFNGAPYARVVHSIVPINASSFTESNRLGCSKPNTPGCTPEALVEIYQDVSTEMYGFENHLLKAGGAMAGFFLLMLVGMFLSGKRAEIIIAKQHELNEELTQAVSSAEARSQDKSQFLASISHELRTPLNAIIGFSEIIRNEAREQLVKEHQDYIDDINNSGKHLLSLINDILDFSKAEAGKLQMEWDEADAGKIIRSSLRLVIPRAEGAQVTLVEDLPQSHLVMITDAKKLKQVLLNLLSNAVKFTPAGGEVRCTAWEDVGTKQLCIQVKDTGIGIAAKDISKVMTPFGQVDSKLSRKYEGTGLGLPLSKKFVELMGGEFKMESEVNVGTTVTIRLPRRPKDAPPSLSLDGEANESTQGNAHVASEPTPA